MTPVTGPPTERARTRTRTRSGPRSGFGNRGGFLRGSGHDAR